MISIILPTRNEPLINELIKEIHTVLKGKKHEIIIIDLSDQPPQIKNARFYRQQSKGLGNAVLEGIRRSRGQIIIVMDADFSHDPHDIPTLLNKMREGYDFVIGSRYCEGGKTEDKEWRYGIFPNSLSSKFYCLFASFLLRLDLKDPMNGFAAARKSIYRPIHLNPLGYKIHMETAFKAKKKGFRITEAPTTFQKRKAGKSNTGLREAMRTLLFIVELRLGLR